MAGAARQIAPEKPGGEEIARLKNLLFFSESQRLGAIETALDALGTHVGTPDRLVLATADVLVEALRKAEIAQHRELSQALAPVVVAAIRSEIKNSKDMMVEALYPITGRLVSAGIAVAMAELAAAINARMDNLLSVDMLKLRFQAWRSGRPLAELALLADRRGQLVRLLYLERGSGQLLGQWQADHGEDGRADLISGMIAALTDFTRNALGPSGGELRVLDLGGRKIYLSTSSQMIVAAEFTGPLAAGQERRLNEAFLTLLDANITGKLAPQQALGALAEDIAQGDEEPAKAKAAVSPLTIVALVALGLLAWLAFTRVQQWRFEGAIDSALQKIVAAHPDLAAFPLKIHTLHGQELVMLNGLVPTAGDKLALEAGLGTAALPYKFAPTLAVVGTAGDIAALTTANAETGLKMRDSLAEISGKLAQRDADRKQMQALLSAGTAAALATTRQELALARQDLSAQISNDIAMLSGKLMGLGSSFEQAQTQQIRAGAATAATQTEIAALNQRLNRPLAQLNEELRGFAVFFEANNLIIEDKLLPERLQAIARLAAKAGGIRVVGYSDESGSPGRNRAISRARAEAVAQRLVASGLARERIIIVARSNQHALADKADATNLRNRRVTLEALLDNEIQP